MEDRRRECGPSFARGFGGHSGREARYTYSMNIITQYTAYLRDNPHGYWFKRKLYGWGWAPARWQGWAVMAVFIVIVISAGIQMAATAEGGEPTQEQFFWFFARILIAVIALIAICYKTGEKPRWMWGLPK